MKSLDELKKEVFGKLAQFPKIEAFFKDSLKERMKINDNWTENALVLILLDDKFFKQSELHNLIDPLYNNHKNFSALRSKLNPRDEYDEKIRDMLAELNGYYNLLKYAFEKIEVLPENAMQKTPDFLARKDDKLYLFEVKNMRAPIDICDFLFEKSEARHHMSPEKYVNVIISFTLSANWRQIELNRQEQETNDLKKQVENWSSEVFNRIESLKPPSFPLFRSTKQDLVIQCRLHKGPAFDSTYGFIDRVDVNDHMYRVSILSPFECKMRRTSCHALAQLLQYDHRNQYKKYVLLNWQRPKESTIPIWDGFVENVLTIVRDINKDFQNDNSNLFVKLLNYDSLP